MKYCNVALKPDEKAIYGLRELYLRYGYCHYKVGKFEEYDLYAGNRSFLISDNILTFTDTDGKLMALKPDVTLSIIKNISDDDRSTHKFFYNENVYRPSASSGGFKEIMQTGLECIGDIDIYSVCEVLVLASKSLSSISDESVLVVSHMGFVLGLLEECKFTSAQKKEALSYIASKNVQALKSMTDNMRVYSELSEALCFAAKFYGKLSDAIDEMEKYCFNAKMKEAYEELRGISDAMNDSSVYADLSLVNDMNYYNSIIFKGYINGIPSSILSGGRYDSLLTKMGKKSGAIGFAVYLDRLEHFYSETSEYDVDVLLLYDKKDSASDVFRLVEDMVKNGKTVKTASVNDSAVKYRTLAKVCRGEVEILETND